MKIWGITLTFSYIIFPKPLWILLSSKPKFMLDSVYSFNGNTICNIYVNTWPGGSMWILSSVINSSYVNKNLVSKLMLNKDLIITHGIWPNSKEWTSMISFFIYWGNQQLGWGSYSCDMSSIHLLPLYHHTHPYNPHA